MTANDLKALICEEFLGGDVSFPLNEDTQLLEEGICDSLGLVRLAAAIEQRVPGIRIDDQDINRDSFGSIRAIMKFVGQAPAKA